MENTEGQKPGHAGVLHPVRRRPEFPSQFKRFSIVLLCDFRLVILFGRLSAGRVLLSVAADPFGVA
jgi:hypothetical protein